MAPIVIAAAVAGTATVASTIIASQAQAKAQNRAKNFAQEQAQEAKAEQQRLEQKFGLSEGELGRQDRMFELEAQRQEELQRRADLTGEELLSEQGPITRSLLEDIERRTGLTSEELFKEEGGLPARQFFKEVTAEGPLAQFKPELDLALQTALQKAGRRGITPTAISGDVGLELFGRAAVDAAISGARERQDLRSNLANTLFNIAASQRAETAQVGKAALTQSETARTEITNFLKDLQVLTQQSTGRAADVALGASAEAGRTTRQAASDIQQITGQQIGEPAAKKRQGLEALGKVATPLITRGIDEIFPKEKETLTQLRGNELEDPFTRFGDITGRFAPSIANLP